MAKTNFKQAKSAKFVDIINMQKYTRLRRVNQIL